VNARIWCGLILPGLLVAVGCRNDKPPAPALIQPRSDFAPDEFGIGKPHTPSASCNRTIDALLDEVRRCYNSRGGETCRSLQQERNRRVAGLKNSVRCQR